jgi:hypothetical protein
VKKLPSRNCQMAPRKIFKFDIPARGTSFGGVLCFGAGSQTLGESKN